MARRPVFFGWKVVAASFAIAVFVWGIGFYGPSIFVREIVRLRGWPVAVVSSAITVHFLFGALTLLGLARLHERFGHVRPTQAGIVASGIGVIGFATAIEPWQLYLAALATGLGWSLTSSAAINAFVSRWFVRQRALAISHAYNGASIGGVVMMPLWSELIATFGFANATMIVAGVGALILCPLAARYLSVRPADLGVYPDNAQAPPVAVATGAAPIAYSAFFRDARFLTLSAAFGVGIFAQMGLITHLVSRLSPVVGDAAAAWALSIATFCAIIGRFSLAVFIGEHRRRFAAAINFAIQAVGIALLAGGSSTPALLAGVILFGFGIGNLLSLPPLILQAEQPAVDVPRALALMSSINQILFAFAPGVFGLLRDWSGDYVVPFQLALIADVVSALLVAGGAWARRRADV